MMIDEMQIDAKKSTRRSSTKKPTGPEAIVDEHIRVETVAEPFLIFPCAKCKEQITLQEHLEPGQAAVISCGNCKESWTVVLPSLYVIETAKYEPVWKQLTA